jgi:hypothetical protein
MASGQSAVALPRASADASSARTAAALVLRVGALVAGAAALELLLMRAARLPAEAYARPVIVLELARHTVSGDAAGAALLVSLLAATVALAYSRSFGPRWESLERGELRWLVVLVAAILAWTFSSYDFNAWYARAHDIDRLLLIALLPCIWWRPVFVFPFLTLLVAVAWQTSWPIEGFSWAGPAPLIRVLFLFSAFMIAWPIRRIRAADLLFAIFCLVAAHYWVPGYRKLRLGWIEDDIVAFLLPATYANGWLGFLSAPTISHITRVLVALNWPMKVGTVLVEWGALVAIWRPTTLRLLLIGGIIFHIGIVLLSGIFFWAWMLLELMLLVLFLRRGAISRLPIFTLPHFLLSLLLIGAGAITFRAVSLSWMDSRVEYTYRMVGIGESGREYALPPAFFAPYDFQFTLNAFRYLVPAARMSITWGATGPITARRLAGVTTPDEVFALEAELGASAFVAGRSAAFDEFIRTFVPRRDTLVDFHWWSRFRAPPLLWTFPRRAPENGGDRLVSVVVREVTSLFDGVRYAEIRTLPVRVIDLPVTRQR